MKTLTITPVRKIILGMFLLSVLQLTRINVAIGQLPDCTSGASMYGIFVNAGGSGVADSTEIRPINYATGAVGALMGGHRYWIRKQIGGLFYYAASALAVDMITNRFYVNTQMPATGGAKDIITINPTMPGTMTVIGTTPIALNDYHFVKLAIAPNGFGYAIGVARDSTLPAATCNPLIRFSTCGALPLPGCATASITVLGYLPSTGLMAKWLLFNGDIAFDNFGNLFFATAAFGRVNGIGRYTDARLFKIDAVDIPAVAGAGTIPMSLVADYDLLDSTVVNGISLDPAGNMYISTRRFAGVQTSPAGPSTPELYVSSVPGVATIIPGFGPITPGFSISDLGGCYFPSAMLAMNKLQLSGQYVSGVSHLKWEVNANRDILHFELQRSDDGNNFETVARIEAMNTTQSDQKYSYSDPQNDFRTQKFYRIKQVMNNGVRFYSNVIKVNINNKMNLTGKLSPNPFINYFDFTVQLKSANTINLRLIDQGGREINHYKFNGTSGENKFTVNGLNGLKRGIYIVELSVEEAVIREKLIRQ